MLCLRQSLPTPSYYSIQKVTILLAFFVNLLVLSNYTPEAAADLPVVGEYQILYTTSQWLVTLIRRVIYYIIVYSGVFYSFNIALVSVSVASSVLVLRLHFRGHKTKRMPLLMKKLLLMHPLNAAATAPFFIACKSPLQSFTCNHSLNEKPIQTQAQPDSESIKLLKKTLKSIKKTNRILLNEKIKQNNVDLFKTEWKEAARRIDLVLFTVSACIVFIVPLILFSKYFFIEPQTLVNKSMCVQAACRVAFSFCQPSWIENNFLAFK